MASDAVTVPDEGAWGALVPGSNPYFESCCVATRSVSRSPARMFGIA